tara:strand:- start:196 stop:357 length:162 start_codon:yes stop_codon:yes gene_type:complete
MSRLDRKIKPYLFEPDITMKIVKDMPESQKKTFYEILREKYPHIEEKKTKKSI